MLNIHLLLHRWDGQRGENECVPRTLQKNGHGYSFPLELTSLDLRLLHLSGTRAVSLDCLLKSVRKLVSITVTCRQRKAEHPHWYQFMDSFWKTELQIVPKRAHKTKGALVLPKAVVHLQVYKSIVHFSMPGFFYECLDFSRPKQLGVQSEIKQAWTICISISS